LLKTETNEHAEEILVRPRRRWEDIVMGIKETERENVVDRYWTNYPSSGPSLRLDPKCKE
jgi:hypothetical protein